MLDIMELHRRLYQNKIEAEEKRGREDNSYSFSRVRARIASTQKDISTLLREGTSPCNISAILGLHPETVRIYIAKIQSQEERYQKEKSDFLTMRGPSQGGYFAILQ